MIGLEKLSSAAFLALLLSGCAAAAGSRTAGAVTVKLSLREFAGNRVDVLPLIPKGKRGEDVRSPDRLLRPTGSLEVRAGDVQVGLSDEPILLWDPDVSPAPAARDPSSPFCLASPTPRPRSSYAAVKRELRDLRINLVRISGFSAARFAFWLQGHTRAMTHTDDAVRDAQQAGCDVVVLLNARNDQQERPPTGESRRSFAQFRPRGRTRRRPGSVPAGMPDLAKWRRFVRDVVERYDGDGQEDMPGLRRPVVGYVVHNEPDLSKFWSGSAEEYGRLAAATSGAVKSVDPDAKVVFAGTAGAVESYLRPGESMPREDPKPFESPFYRRQDGRGLLLRAAKQAARQLPADNRAIDVMDFHIYGKADAWRKLGLLAGYVRRTAEDVGWPWCEVWCMETATWGPATSRLAPFAKLRGEQTERQQASSLVKRFAYGRARGVTRIWWYALRLDTGGSRALPFDDMALIVDGRTRLGYFAFRTLAQSLNGCDWDKTTVERDGDDGIYVVRFMRGGRPLWVAWRE